MIVRSACFHRIRHEELVSRCDERQWTCLGPRYRAQPTACSTKGNRCNAKNGVHVREGFISESGVGRRCDRRTDGPQQHCAGLLSDARVTVGADIGSPHSSLADRCLPSLLSEPLFCSDLCPQVCVECVCESLSRRHLHLQLKATSMPTILVIVIALQHSQGS